MKKIISVICALTILGLSALTAPALAAGEPVTLNLSGTAAYSDAFEMLDKINDERSKAGLASLTMDEELLTAAMQRSAELALSYQMARPDGSRWTTALPERFDSTKRGQNVYAGIENAGQVVSLFMGSQSHRATMLDGEYSSMGVGCFIQKDYTYWVQIFSSAPANQAERRTDRSSASFTVSADVENMDFGIGVTSNSGRVYPQLRLHNTNRKFQKERIVLDNGGLTYVSAEPQVVCVLDNGYFASFRSGSANVTCFAGNTALDAATVTSAGKNAVMGDGNGDGRVDNADLVLTARYIVGYDNMFFVPLCDYDGNGTVDNTDLVTLARQIVS